MKNLLLPILLLLLSYNINNAHAQNLVINEVVASNITGLCDSTGSKNDWIEIYNPNTYPVNLYGYSLSDNDEKPDKWQFPNVYIYPKDYVVVYASEAEDIETQLHCNFKLAKEGEIISLYNPTGQEIDKVELAALADDISYGRNERGEGNMTYYEHPTPGAANTTPSYRGFVKEKPSFTKAAGFYTEAISISAEHKDKSVVLRYTIDGSEPTEQSPILSSSIQIDDASHRPNYFSLIKTNPGFDYPLPGYEEDRANTRGWLPPSNEVAKGTLFKVKAFKDNYIASESASTSYFIFPEGAERYSFPVMSITTKEENFFDDEIGIYVYGTTGAEGNYKESGCAWERPVEVQYFENDGSFAFQQKMGARIHGGGGRHSAIKNVRLYARDEYGKSSLKYDFYNDSENDEFKRILVRGPGHRPDCAPRDDLADLLLQNQDMDLQHVQHVIVFVNGEYWGLHTIKERFDLDYLSIKYGKKDDDFVIMKNSGSLDKGEEGDDQHYFDLLDYIENHDMSLPEHLEYVKTQIDMDNYLSYLAAEIFMGNVDWIITNIKFWRYKGDEMNTQTVNPLDGRWRWFMFDFDLVFGGSCHDINPKVHIMDDVFDPEIGKATILARGLKQNSEFERDFVNRICDQMNSMFSLSNFRKRLHEIDTLMSPEMQEHTQRWHYPSVVETLSERQHETPSLTQWYYMLDSLYRYPVERKRKMIDHLNDAFSLADTANITLNVNDKTMGYVKINSLNITSDLDGVSASVYPWSGMYFQDLPIHIEAIAKPGYRFVKWANTQITDTKLELSLDEDRSIEAVFAIDPDYNTSLPLLINEIMASNKEVIADEYHAYSDWIEIYNPNNRPIDLSGYYISDDLKSLYKYQFTSQTNAAVIPAKGYQILWCSDQPERGVWHTNFKLSADGETIILLSPDSSLLDMIEFGKQGEDVSYGRHTDGAEQWIYFNSPLHATPGYSNNKAAAIDEHSFRLALYPNPVRQGDIVHLPQITDYKLYDRYGQLIQQSHQTNSLSTTTLPIGVYIVNTEKYGSQKLMVK